MEVRPVTLLIDIPVAMAILLSFTIPCNLTKWELFSWLPLNITQWDGAYMMSFLTYRLRRSFRT